MPVNFIAAFALLFRSLNKSCAAGHETTANALTWTVYLLSQSLEWRERAESEADRSFDPQQPAATEGCETLRAVFEEAMRLYPPAAMLSRQAIADDELAGVHIPAGAVISGIGGGAVYATCVGTAPIELKARPNAPAIA